MVFVPRTFRKGDQTEVADDSTEEAILLYDGWLPDEGAPPPPADPNRHVTVAELSILPELATAAVIAIEDAPAVAPAGVWDFAQPPKVAGVELGGGQVDQQYVDAGDTAAKARANHTGTQAAATISDLTEVVQDIVGALIVAGTNTTVTYNDVANTFTINATASGGTTDPEIVRDVIGTAMVAGSGIQITVNDVGDTLTVASTAVPPTRQVISGTGLTGGGDLSVDRTLAVSYGTAAGTAAQGNDSRITGAVPNTRSVISGTGLSGGGTLAADRTLSVSYGSAAGTAVQGNDTRVTADQAAATASIRTLGTGATQAAAGNHTHTAAGISDSTATGRSILTAADAAAVRAAAGAAARAVTIRTITAADSLTLADANDVLINSTAAAAIAFTFPSDTTAAIPIGSSGTVRQGGAGVITATAGTGATLQSRGSALKTAGLYASFVWTKIAANTFDIAGDVTA